MNTETILQVIEIVGMMIGFFIIFFIADVAYLVANRLVNRVNFEYKKGNEEKEI